MRLRFDRTTTSVREYVFYVFFFFKIEKTRSLRFLLEMTCKKIVENVIKVSE